MKVVFIIAILIFKRGVVAAYSFIKGDIQFFNINTKE